MSVKLLTEHHLEFLSLKGGCSGSSESTLVKIPHCWKSHVTAHFSSTQSYLELVISKESDNLVIYSTVKHSSDELWLCCFNRPTHYECGIKVQINIYMYA